MPRPSRGGASAGPKPANKFKQCIEALVRDPEAACLGGNDFCCAGCGGNSDLVDSLCAFCLHSDAARRYFAANGGLDALLLGAQAPLEKAALGSLQILQCLCSTTTGQDLVSAQRPELVDLVCQLACEQDEEKEGVQHAGLTMLTAWADDPEASITRVLLQRLDEAAAAGNVQQAANTGAQEGSAEPPAAAAASHGAESYAEAKKSGRKQVPTLLQIAKNNLVHPLLAIRKAAAQLFVATAVACTAPPGRSPLLSNDLAGEVSMGCAGDDVQHATTEEQATQPGQAQEEGQQGQGQQGQAPSGGKAAAAALACARLLVLDVQGVLQAELAAAASPNFNAFANGNSRLMLDPLAFLTHQNQMVKNKSTCQALLHVAAELCAPSAGAVGEALLRETGLAHAVLSVFEAAWRVGAAAPQAAPGEAGALGIGMASAAAAAAGGLGAPFAFLQDHQSRELALDTLMLMVASPRTLRLLAPSEPPSPPSTPAVTCENGATVAGPDAQQGAAAAAVPGGGSAHERAREREERALVRLRALVMDLLSQQSASHVRAGLTLMGHVHFEHPGRTRAAAAGPSTSPAAATAAADAAQPGALEGGAEEPAVVADAGSVERPQQQQWMQLLCDVFDAAWASEAESSEADRLSRGGALMQAAAAAAAAPVYAFPEHPSSGSNSSAMPGSAFGQGSASASQSQLAAAAMQGPAGQEWSRQGSVPGAPPSSVPGTPGGSGAAAGPGSGGPFMHLEMGLGYRVLVQVLQAWRHLLEKGSPAVRSAMDATGWSQRASQALAHPKGLVASAAAKLMMLAEGGRGQPGDAGAPGSGQAGGPGGGMGIGFGPGVSMAAQAWADLELLGAVGGGGAGAGAPAGGASGAAAAAGAGPAQNGGPLPQQQQQQQQALADDIFSSAVAAMALHSPSPGTKGASQEAGAAAGAGAGGPEPIELDGPGLSGALDGPGLSGPLDTDMQDFLSAFLNDGAAGGGDSQQQAEGAAGGDMAGGTGDVTMRTVGNEAGLFASWQMAEDPNDEELLAEAMALLPDLDNMAKNACAKYDRFMPGTAFGGVSSLPPGLFY